MDLFQLLGRITIDNSEANKNLDDTSKKGKDAESKLGKAFGGIGKVAGAAGKAIGIGMVAAGTAVAGVVTKSVQAYADFEQLKGGVDTLFGTGGQSIEEYSAAIGKSTESIKQFQKANGLAADGIIGPETLAAIEKSYKSMDAASSTVMKNASVAFKTAGLSANEYMETVTGFSASLISSLGGDTAKAAGLADQAIIDMADNANKMGSDITSIQNAYQGFAKQNYTMLDNLKLGYGGTKEEMQRLLSDAEKLTGKKFDISNFADITEAIHAIQTEMGITGTTAAEASTTISGSIASMGASWQNLLTAISADDLPFDKYVDDFVTSVATVTDNLIPRIGVALEGVVNLVGQLAPIIIEKLPGLFEQILPPLIEAATGLVQALVDAAPGILEVLMNCLPALIDGVTTLFTALVTALPELVNLIIEALPMVVEMLVAALPEMIPALIDGLVSMIVTLCTNFAQIIQPIIDYLPEIIVAIVNALLTNLPALLDGLVQLVAAIVVALPAIYQAVVDAVEMLLSDWIGSLAEWAAPLISAISAWWDGVKTSASQKWEEIKTTVSQLATDLWTSLTTTVSSIWTDVTTWFTDIKTNVTETVTGLWTDVTGVFSNLWTDLTETVSSIWTDVTSKFTEISTSVSDTASNIWDSVSGVFNDLWADVTSIWDSIKTAIEDPINTAKETVTSVIDTIKGAFDFDWKLPSLSLPHFSVHGGEAPWGFGGAGRLPGVSVSWYAKAVREPVMLEEPTVFGYNPKTGSFLGGGEAGSEVVAGTSKLMQMISGAVAQQNAELVYYVQQITAMLANYFPDALEAMQTPMVLDPNGAAIAMAPAMNEQLGKITIQKSRGR